MLFVCANSCLHSIWWHHTPADSAADAAAAAAAAADSAASTADTHGKAITSDTSSHMWNLTNLIVYARLPSCTKPNHLAMSKAM